MPSTQETATHRTRRVATGDRPWAGSGAERERRYQLTVVETTTGTDSALAKVARRLQANAFFSSSAERAGDEGVLAAHGHAQKTPTPQAPVVVEEKKPKELAGPLPQPEGYGKPRAWGMNVPPAGA